MANKELIIDDDYCQKMGQYFSKQSENIETVISGYISILEEIKEKAIISGAVSRPLESYIACANKLMGKFNEVSYATQSHINNFIKRVDEEDQYLF